MVLMHMLWTSSILGLKLPEADDLGLNEIPNLSEYLHGSTYHHIFVLTPCSQTLLVY